MLAPSRQTLFAHLSEAFLTLAFLLITSPAWSSTPPPLAELVKKAEAGEGASQLALAMRYDGAENVAEKDVGKALHWYKIAATKGYAEAQSVLGIFYMKGEGTLVDPVEGARWFAKAAEQGHPVAQLNLASCYANGEGLSRDMKLAAQWFREAAERNEATAQYYLGILYGRGDGVPQNYVESYKWLSVAAAQGVAAARSSLETLDSVLPPDQLAEAQKAAASVKAALVGR